MKIFWIIIFSVLLIINFVNLFKDFLLPFVKERKNSNRNGTCHEKCSYSNNNECNFAFAKIWRKIKKENDNLCPGSEKCAFFVCEDVNTGEIKRANSFHLIINAFFSQISTITAIILTAYEIVEKIIEK